MPGFYVVLGATAAILLFLWHRGNQRRDTDQADIDHHGRGVADEAATAIGDVAREVIGPAASDKKGPAGHPDGAPHADG
ncbi:MAG: hypothetical protein WC729_03200 [Sphingomonas sp.]|jgi:hypothetical protein|uniref:hypothetical protein n=1 Tax=Sphingomonas sp. TaxID=28214 RepID=UPI003568FF7A